MCRLSVKLCRRHRGGTAFKESSVRAFVHGRHNRSQTRVFFERRLLSSVEMVCKLQSWSSSLRTLTHSPKSMREESCSSACCRECKNNSITSRAHVSKCLACTRIHRSIMKQHNSRAFVFPGSQPIGGSQQANLAPRNSWIPRVNLVNNPFKNRKAVVWLLMAMHSKICSWSSMKVDRRWFFYWTQKSLECANLVNCT